MDQTSCTPSAPDDSVPVNPAPAHQSLLLANEKGDEIHNPPWQVLATRKGGDWSGVELYDLRETPDPVLNLAEQQPDVVRRTLEMMPSLTR